MAQLNLFEEPQEFGKPIQILNGEHIYIINFYNCETANRFFEKLIKEIKVIKFNLK
jgi:hypothetical protein